MFVQACISQPPVEGCNKAVLHRLTGGDVVPGDSPILLPCEQRMRGQLRAGVADHQARQAARFRPRNRAGSLDQLGAQIGPLAVDLNARAEHKREKPH